MRQTLAVVAMMLAAGAALAGPYLGPDDELPDGLVYGVVESVAGSTEDPAALAGVLERPVRPEREAEARVRLDDGRELDAVQGVPQRIAVGQRVAVVVRTRRGARIESVLPM
jgi:hypothetical protein